MQIVVVFCLTIPTVFQLSKYPAGSIFNVQGIVDTIGNILFVLSAAMFLLSYCIQQYKNKDNYKHNKQATFIISSICAAMLLVCIGKVLFSLEATCGAIYTGNPGLFGDSLPLALIIRSIGMAVFCIAYAFMVYNSICANKKLEAEVSGSNLNKGLSVVNCTKIPQSVEDDQSIGVLNEKEEICAPRCLDESLLENVNGGSRSKLIT